jgi:PIN domain nuclease of toxin-antitoxin system
MRWALDASAMMAFLRQEPGADLVIDALTEPGDQRFAHYVNLCELFYAILRDDGEDDAEAARRFIIEVAGVVPYGADDAEVFWEAGRLRAIGTSERLAVALGDCFCIATARALGCAVLTADRREFEPMALMGLCAVTFIR